MPTPGPRMKTSPPGSNRPSFCEIDAIVPPGAGTPDTEGREERTAPMPHAPRPLARPSLDSTALPPYAGHHKENAP